MFFPVMIDLEKYNILIAGGGKIGLRKAKNLINNGANVTVISRNVDKGFDDLDKEKIKIIKKEIELKDFEQANIIYAATDNKELNKKIASYCIEHGKMVNCVDNHKNSSFINTGFIKKKIEDNDVVVAVSLMGNNPRKTKELKNKIQELIENSLEE